jgi:hypothetical protein
LSGKNRGGLWFNHFGCHFSLLAQRKVTKRKGPTNTARRLPARALSPRLPATRLPSPYAAPFVDTRRTESAHIGIYPPDWKETAGLKLGAYCFEGGKIPFKLVESQDFI